MIDVMNLLNQSLVSASDWFVSVFNASGMVEIYLAFIFLILAMRFLVVPIFGRSRGSDRARSKNEVDSDE